ncbi:FimV/HubP family polar landmark protein [Pseudidiomarina taiwanensis]|uniref:FimV/HubP family polar landmark protein n=1 Tax=Pseudidiomarina taiwanensis TaxID=337250 RepID=UPI000F87CD3D|nr:FimV/HubP family polar landmark protein [Pseudidiomarina taiwanensis]
MAIKTAGIFLASAVCLTALVGAQTAHGQLRLLPQLTMLQSSATVSRWQDDRFGPIVSSDTLWTIATYYGQKRGLSVYAMMDLIVANNPRVFINNSPDRMLDGYYLDIPQINSGLDETGTYVGRAAQQAQQQALAEDVAAADENSEAIVTVDPLAEEEMQAMRDQLAESIALIESLQQQNSELQADLARVTSELEALQESVDVERQAEIELQRMAAEVTEDARAELTAQQAAEPELQPELQPEPEVTAEPEVAAQPEPEPELESKPESEPEVTVQAEVVEAAEPQTQPAVVETPVRAASVPKQTSPDFFQWLMQPPQLWLAIAVPVILILVIWYVWYVRRLSKEEHGTYHDVQNKRRDEDTNVDATAEPQVEADAELDTAIDEANGSGAAIAATSETFVEEEPEQEAEHEPEQEPVSDEEQSLDFELAQFEPEQQETDTAAADAIAVDSLEEEPAEAEVEIAELEDTPATADESDELAVAEDDPLLADLDDIDWSEASLELEPQPDTETEIETEVESSTEIELDDSDEEFVPIEKLLEEAEAEASDEAEDLYRAEDVSDVLGEVEQTDDEPEPAAPADKDVLAKLDLVHAYIEMGESDEALEMLRKIGVTDDAEVDREVAELIQQLEGRSGR